MFRRFLNVCAGLALVLVSCSDSAGPGDPPIVDPGPQPNPEGVLLPGDPGDNALAATYKLPPSAADEADLSDEHIKTRLEVMISPSATVGEVNTALIDTDSRIVSMRAQTAHMVLKIQPRETIPEAQTLGSTLVATSGFLFARPAYRPKTGPILSAPFAKDGGPLGVLPESGNSRIGYLGAARIPAVWNAMDAIKSKAVVHVPDIYASNSVHPQIPSQIFIAGAGKLDFDDGNHGYHVSGTIGAAFDADLPSGVHPGPVGMLSIRSLHVGGLTWMETMDDAADLMPSSGRFVMNTSLGYNDPDFSETDKTLRAIHAMYWRIVTGDKTDRFLHATAAGNDGDVAGDGGEATFGSPFNLSRYFADPRDATAGEAISATDSIAMADTWALLAGVPGGQSAPVNVLVVGSSDTTGAETKFSSRDSEVRMVGEEVWNACLLPPAGASGPGDCDGDIERMSGTSMATPQVAGLAAYMWSIDPNLSISKTIDIILRAYSNGNLNGLIDAYMAILSIDTSLPSADVRKTILDVAGAGASPGTNGKFDHNDISLYLTMFESFETMGSATEDYSRFDLNGDGFTGTDLVASIDLNVDPIPTFGTVTRTIEGQTVTFNEDIVSDLDMLCYYAYSPLYEGDHAERASLLEDCLPAGGGSGSVRIWRATHSIRGTAYAGLGGAGCDVVDPCSNDDLVEETSDMYTYAKNGVSTAACGAASASANMQVDARSDADPQTGVFGTLDAMVMATGNASADNGYISILANSTSGGKSASAGASWGFEVQTEAVAYTLTGNASVVSSEAAGTGGILNMLLIETKSTGAFIRAIHEFRLTRGDSDSWSESGTLEPGFYAVYATASVTLITKCNEPAVNSTSNGQFSFAITP